MEDFGYGPCAAPHMPGGGSHYCQGGGTAKLDPAGVTLDLVMLCPACTTYRTTLADLTIGEPDDESARVIALDEIYGMGAAA